MGTIEKLRLYALDYSTVDIKPTLKFDERPKSSGFSPRSTQVLYLTLVPSL